ncbi:MAG: 4'-phosphopantetheinyl transferase superfamily protein [Bacteroidales bacterium]|nr:4'-phosphopantetheinyl transferase superfamily protein [Bacteroidales bacterium]
MTVCYIFDRLDDFDESVLEAALELVSPSRRKKALSYVRMRDRKTSVAAELLLRYALKDMGIKGPFPEICNEASGKPFFRDIPSLHFNLSHCALCVACVVGDEPVGVDVECTGAYSPELAKFVLNAEELAAVLQAASPEIEFTRLWTMKESLLKCTGEGLREDMKNVLATLPHESTGTIPVLDHASLRCDGMSFVSTETDGHCFHTTASPGGYVLTVCSGRVPLRVCRLNSVTALIR